MCFMQEQLYLWVGVVQNVAKNNTNLQNISFFQVHVYQHRMLLLENVSDFLDDISYGPMQIMD